MVDKRKAEEISGRAKEVLELVGDINTHILNTVSTSTIPTDMSVFISDYYLSNRNVLVADLLIALKANSFPIDWITHKPEQIVDSVTFVTLIICSEKQGNIKC